MKKEKPHIIAYRQLIMKWRDRHSFAAMDALNKGWRDLRPVIAKQLDGIGWKDSLYAPNAFIRDQVDPTIIEYFEPIVADSVQAAKTELEEVFPDKWTVDTEIPPSADEESHLVAALDILKGVAPLAAGLAMGAAIPSMAVVSGTAVLGLVATSTISMPMVFGGLAIAGMGVATGAIKTSALRENAKKRMLARVDHHVARSLLDPELDEKHSAILARLLESYRNAAAVALGDS